jgi:Erythromycin esterase
VGCGVGDVVGGLQQSNQKTQTNMTRFSAFAFLLLAFLFTHAMPRLLAQALPSTATTAVLQADITNGIADNLPVFDATFYDNQLFLLGESHGFQKPQDVDLALLKHLNQRVGVRYYVAEVDMTKAYFLNQYLKTGNDATLMKVFRSWVAEKVQWANRDFFGKIQRIRALNQTLPANRQIQFLGLDRIQERALVAEHLTELLAGKALPASARLLADSLQLRLTTKCPDSLRANLALRWLADLQANPATYKKEFGTFTANELRHILQNVSYLKTIRSREKTIFANFESLYIRLNLQTEKLYGLWGFFHILQAPLADGGKSFAAMINESSLPVRNKIVSLSCSYVGSKMMVPSEFLPPFWQEKDRTFSRVDKFNNDGPMMTNDGIEAMKATTQPNTVTVFKLVGSAAGKRPIQIAYSPFMPKEQQIAFDPARPTTDYFQYVVLIRNSEATEPLAP